MRLGLVLTAIAALSAAPALAQDKTPY